MPVRITGMTRLLSFLIACALLLPLPAAAWSKPGHRMVGDIAQRHLTPAASAQVAELLQGAEQMTGQRGKPRNGALQVVSALDSYARYFADPDFRPLAH